MQTKTLPRRPWHRAGREQTHLCVWSLAVNVFKVGGPEHQVWCLQEGAGSP